MNKYILILVILFFGCGETKANIKRSDAKKLCDGREERVLTLREDGFHQIPSTRWMFIENGGSFVTLNGKCEFWTWGHIPKEKRLGSDMRMKVHTGTLDQDQLNTLVSMLKWDRWNEIYGTSLPQNELGGDIIFSGFSENSEFLFTSRRTADDVLRTEIGSGLWEATAYLHSIGEPVKTRKLRIYVNEKYEDSAWQGTEEPPLFIDWPDFGVSVQELSDKQNPYCPGKSFLVEDENAVRVFSKARDDYAAQLDKTFPFLMGVIDKSGGKHELYIRDVLPFENELGLVAQGEFGTELCF